MASLDTKHVQLWPLDSWPGRRVLGNDVDRAPQQWRQHRSTRFIYLRWPVSCGGVHLIMALQGGPVQQTFLLVSEVGSLLIAATVPENVSPQQFATVKAVSQFTVVQTRTTPWAHLKAFGKGKRHACKQTVYCTSDNMQLSPFKFPARQNCYLKIELYLERCPHAQFIRYLNLRLTIPKHQPHGPRNTEKSDSKAHFAKKVRKSFWVRTSFIAYILIARTALKISRHIAALERGHLTSAQKMEDSGQKRLSWL